MGIYFFWFLKVCSVWASRKEPQESLGHCRVLAGTKDCP